MISQTPSYGVVLVTTGSSEEAEAIATAAIEAELAACVSITPIRSIYSWQGKICSESEWQLVLKTDLTCFPSLEIKIKQLHSYELPEIIALPILTGTKDYLDWIGQNVQP